MSLLNCLVVALRKISASPIAKKPRDAPYYIHLYSPTKILQLILSKCMLILSPNVGYGLEACRLKKSDIRP